MPLSSARLVRIVRGLAMMVVVVGLSIVGAGSAAASGITNAEPDQTNSVALVLGVPLTTAAWAVLGLMLMTAGMVVSSRSNRRSALSLVPSSGPADDLAAVSGSAG